MRALVLLSLLSLFGSLRPALAQEEKDPLPTPDEVLAAIDSRIYSPSAEGLKGFRFRMSMAQSTGVFAEDLKSVYLELSYQAPKSWSHRLVGPDGKELQETPETFASEEGVKLLDFWVKNLSGISQHFLIGITWKERYRDYYKELRRYLVNNKVEYRLTMNPRSKSDITTVVLKIVSGLPREITQINAKGGHYLARYHFEQREELGGKYILKGTKHEMDNIQILEESYDYLTRKSFVLLSKVTRIATEGELRQQFFNFENLEVNPEFPKGYFDAETASSQPSEDAQESKKPEEAKESETK